MTQEHAHFRIGGAWFRLVEVYAISKNGFQSCFCPFSRPLDIQHVLAAWQYPLLIAAVHFDKSKACLSMVGVYVLCLPQHLFGISLARQLILRIEARHGCGGKPERMECLQKSTPNQ